MLVPQGPPQSLPHSGVRWAAPPFPGSRGQRGTCTASGICELLLPAWSNLGCHLAWEVIGYERTPQGVVVFVSGLLPAWVALFL